MSEKDIENLVISALKNCNLTDYKIKINGPNNKGEGYATDVVFATAEGSNESGDKSLHFALKISKDSELLRNHGLMREVSLKEIYVYEVVKVAFEKFQQKQGLDCEIRFMPFCYATVVENERETLIFENLKTQGFELWDKTLPMTLKHVRLVLEAYGQWHALSMALKMQQPSVFGKLVDNNVNMFTKVCELLNLGPLTIKEFSNLREKLTSRDDAIFKNLQFSAEDISHVFKEMFFEDAEYHVILHGDCWTNNFLFKTANNPLEVRVLDWQCSGLASPAFDLSHFIFCCADTERHQDVKEFLKIYHESFCKQLVACGCDPQAIFPFDKLLEHWKKFSRFGLIVSSLIIKLCLNSDKVLDAADVVNQGKDVSQMFDISVDGSHDYYKRIRNNFLFYCKNVES